MNGAQCISQNMWLLSEKFYQKELEADKTLKKVGGTEVREAVISDISLPLQSRMF